MPSGGTHYQLLGVAPTASVDEIRAAYRRLARALHPDAHGGAAAPAMASVNEAWRVLSDPGRRAELRRHPPPTASGSPRGRRSPRTTSPRIGSRTTGTRSSTPRRPESPRRLAVVLAVTIVVVLVLLAALFFYAFTRSGTLPPARSGRALPVLLG